MQISYRGSFLHRKPLQIAQITIDPSLLYSRLLSLTPEFLQVFALALDDLPDPLDGLLLSQLHDLLILHDFNTQTDIPQFLQHNFLFIALQPQKHQIRTNHIEEVLVAELGLEGFFALGFYCFFDYLHGELLGFDVVAQLVLVGFVQEVVFEGKDRDYGDGQDYIRAQHISGNYECKIN